MDRLRNIFNKADNDVNRVIFHRALEVRLGIYEKSPRDPFSVGEESSRNYVTQMHVNTLDGAWGSFIVFAFNFFRHQMTLFTFHFSPDLTSKDEGIQMQ